MKKTLLNTTSFLTVILVLLFCGFCADLRGSIVEQILDADYDILERSIAPETGGFEPVSIAGGLGYVWSLPDRTQAMVFLGNFSLEMSDQRLTSRDAVVWLKRIERDGQRINQLDIFMEGGARIVEKTGGVVSDDILAVTLYTAGQVTIGGRSIAYRDGSDQEIYQRAQMLWTRATVTPSIEREIIVHAPPAAEPPIQERRPITIRGNFIAGPEVDGQPVLIGTGGVYVIQAAGPDGEATELLASNAVLFLRPEALREADRTRSATDRPVPPDAPITLTPEQAERRLEQLPTEEEAARTMTPMERAGTNQYVASAYLEGDVVLIRGYRQVRADQLYYDFETSQALIYNMVARTVAIERNVPVYVRASEARQLSETQFMATDAKLSTSEFHTPSYHVGATRIFLEDRTERLDTGEQIGLLAGRFRIYNATLNVEGVPILYWPYLQGDFKQSETAIRSVSFSYDNDFGLTAKTRWYLLPLLGLQQPEGVEAFLKLDYYGDHGPAFGVDVDYERETYFGLIRSYYVRDTGKDQLGGVRDEVEPPNKNRGWFLTRHRQYLPQDWELTFELSYLSDRNFLEQYFRGVFEEDKEQETLIYLRRVFGDSVLSILGKWRINDFLTQTEKLPELTFDVLGKQLGDGVVTWFSENRIGAVRRAVDNDIPWYYVWRTNQQSSDIVLRGDTRQEVDVPLAIGPVNIVPFGMIRGTAWDDSPFEGGLQRIFGQVGVRGSTYQWRTYDNIESRFWDINRIRHIMKQDFTVWGSATNVRSHRLFRFDEGIETMDAVDGFTAGWRNRFQTKRGEPGNLRTVDWLTLDLEAGFFNNSQTYDGRNRTRGQTFSYRPENSVSSNYVSLRSNWRLSDSTALLYDAIVDTDAGRLGTSGVGLFVERIPRMSAFIGHRYIGLTKSNLMIVGATYQLTPKYTLAVQEEFDLDRGKNSDLEITLVRKMHRWNVAVTAGFDNTQNVQSVYLAIWPEGIPEWTLGSRRFNRLIGFLPLE